MGGPNYQPPQDNSWQTGWGAPPPGYPVRPPRTNVLAIASLVLGVIGGCLLAVPLGIVALVQINKSGDRGRGLAIGGLVASGAWLLIAVLLVATGTLRGALEVNPTVIVEQPLSTTTRGGAVGVNEVRVGDCLDGLRAGSRTVTVAPCERPHDAEVIIGFDLPAGTWPGAEAVRMRATDGCEAKLREVLRTLPSPRDFQVVAIHPDDAQRWLASRFVRCAVRDPAGAKLIGKIPR
ncbi:DUF4190 domain-containing protein [Nocardia sp. NPDC052566]|uniref:DUF4190 domain-containing protein n=1 Tax=Nocardia sp. NPDC052566 TaxID=3364330 RepID=UPI0037C62AD9